MVAAMVHAEIESKSTVENAVCCRDVVPFPASDPATTLGRLGVGVSVHVWLVTALNHMPRSVMLFGMALPHSPTQLVADVLVGSNDTHLCTPALCAYSLALTCMYAYNHVYIYIYIYNVFMCRPLPRLALEALQSATKLCAQHLLPWSIISTQTAQG